MRRRLYTVLILFSAVLPAVIWLRTSRQRLPAKPVPSKGKVVAVPQPREPGASTELPQLRLFVLAINGGGSPQRNYQSHLSHLKGLLNLLHRAGVPANRITVLAGDGSDPTPDMVLREENIGADGWRLRGTPVEEYFAPQGAMGNSEVTGATLYPATRGSLSIWMMTVGQQLGAGDTLLLYVTDHGSRGPEPEENRIVLWGDGQGLSVRELRSALETLDPSVRVVALMSQCYSGAFGSLLDLGGEQGEPTGRFCGFFSTTADRQSYGCYPETRDDPKVGHSFAFLQALPAAAGRFALAHELALEFDDTPDVPLRTSDLYLGAVLAEAASVRGVSVGQFVDDLLKQAWGEQPGWNLDVQRVDRLAAQFGLPTTRRRADVEKTLESLERLPSPLERLAGEADKAMEEKNLTMFGRFRAARTDWRTSLVPSLLKVLDPNSRLRLGTMLASDLAAFCDDSGDDPARAAKQERDVVKQLVFRTRIRMAALARLEKMLDSIAGWLYLADRPTERAVAQKLADCEDLDLKLPKAKWVDPGPALPLLDNEMALAKSLLAKMSASGPLKQPALHLGEAAPSLDLVPYRGDIPKVGSGKPLLLFFWATWCKACKAVLPDLLALARKRNLAILAVTDDNEANLDRFFAVPREFPSVVGQDPAHQLGARFGVRALPTFVLLDGQGKLGSEVTNSLRDLPEENRQ